MFQNTLYLSFKGPSQLTFLFKPSATINNPRFFFEKRGDNNHIKQPKMQQ